MRDLDDVPFVKLENTQCDRRDLNTLNSVQNDLNYHHSSLNDGAFKIRANQPNASISSIATPGTPINANQTQSVSNLRRSKRPPNERRFKCEQCDRKFFTRKDVKRHLVVHTGVRNYACHFCQQRFGRKDHLVRHAKKSHQKETSSQSSIVSTGVAANRPPSTPTSTTSSSLFDNSVTVATPPQNIRRLGNSPNVLSPTSNTNANPSANNTDQTSNRNSPSTSRNVDQILLQQRMFTNAASAIDSSSLMLLGATGGIRTSDDHHPLHAAAHHHHHAHNNGNVHDYMSIAQSSVNSGLTNAVVTTTTAGASPLSEGGFVSAANMNLVDPSPAGIFNNGHYFSLGPSPPSFMNPSYITNCFGHLSVSTAGATQLVAAPAIAASNPSSACDQSAENIIGSFQTLNQWPLSFQGDNYYAHNAI